jgi:hypothetical protein
VGRFSPPGQPEQGYRDSINELQVCSEAHSVQTLRHSRAAPCLDHGVLMLFGNACFMEQETDLKMSL